MFAWPAWGAQHEIERLFQYAWQKNPSITSAKFQLQGAQADIDVARWQRWPSLSASGTLQKGKPGIVLSVTQPLWMGGELTARIRSTEAMARAAEIQVAVTGNLLALRMLDAWQSFVSAHYKLAVMESSLQQYDHYQAMMMRRVEAKVSPGIDLELLQMRTMQARADANDLRVLKQESLSRLEVLLGMPLQDNQISGLLERSPVESLRMWATPSTLERLIKNIQVYSPIAKAQFEADAARHNAAVAQAQLWPHLSARYDFQQGGLYDGNASLFTIGLSFQPGAGLSSLAQARAQKARAAGLQLAVDEARQNLSESIHIDWESLSRNLARMEVQDFVVSSAREVLNSYERQFIAGRKSWLDVLNALRELTAHQLSMGDSVAGAHAAYYRLRCRSDDLIPKEAVAPALASGQR